MRNVFALLTNRIVAIPVTAARPSIVTDGADVTSWRADGTYASRLASLFIGGTVACTITSPTGGASGVELWGYRLAAWWRIGYLNDGADIAITSATQGYATQVDTLGVFDRLAIAGTASAGVASSQAAPVESFS